MKVFSFACLDGGATGRSLSLTSRFVRDVSRDFRYRSIAVHDIRQIDRFAAHLRIEQAKTHKIPIVCHLFISAPNWSEVDLAAWAEGEDVARVRGALFSLRTLWQARLRTTTGDLLQLVAPSLQTLFLHGNTLDFSAPGRIQFLVLTSLSIPRDPFWDSTDPIIPALRRLHIETFHGDTRPFWDRLAIFVPSNNLTHLRLSGVEARDVEDLPAYLRVQLGVPPLHESDFAYPAGSAAADMAAQRTKTLSSLKHVWVEPQQTDAGGWIGPAADSRQWMLEQLGALEQQARQNTACTFTLLPERNGSYDMEHAMSDWLHVASGGDGPWII